MQWTSGRLLQQIVLRNCSEILARRCSGNQHGIVRKYGLNMTRRDFREKAETMGWKKVRFRRFCLEYFLGSNFSNYFFPEIGIYYCIGLYDYCFLVLSNPDILNKA